MVKLKEWMMILELHRQGLSVSAIAERTGHDRKTVRKYIREGLATPKYKPRHPRPTVVEPYEAYLRERVTTWPELTGERLLREIDSSISPDARPSDIAEQLDYVLRFIKGRMLVVVVADEVLPDARTADLMRRLRARHELLWLTVRDADLAPGPDAPGQEDSMDIGTGSGIPLPLAADRAVRAAYKQAMTQRADQRRDLFRRLGIAEQQTTGSDDVVTTVFALLEKHRQGALASRGGPKRGQGAG